MGAKSSCVPQPLRDWAHEREYQRALKLLDLNISTQHRHQNAFLEQIAMYQRKIDSILEACLEFDRNPSNVEVSQVYLCNIHLKVKTKLLMASQRHIGLLVNMQGDLQRTRMIGVHGDIVKDVSERIKALYHAESPEKRMKQSMKTIETVKEIKQHQDEMKDAEGDMHTIYELEDEETLEVQAEPDAAQLAFDTLMTAKRMKALPKAPTRLLLPSSPAAELEPSSQRKGKAGYSSLQ